MAIIHNDCHLDNALQTPAGEVVLIDWEGGGRGPAIVDLGFLLISSDFASSGPRALHPDPGRIKAVIDGYCLYRVPTDQELDRLVDALRFRALVYGGCRFAATIAAGAPVDHLDSCWARYDAAEAIAARAWEQFELYRLQQA